MDVLPAVPDSKRQRTLLEMSGFDMENVGQFIDTAISITDEQHPSYSFPIFDWLGSNPQGYQKWFITRMQDVFDERREAIALTERKDVSKVPSYRVKTPLQRSIQLLKRHRDVMFADDENQLKPISIIITTLAAKAYNQERELVPAFTNIVENMDRFIDEGFDGPKIMNPVDPRENFADKWGEHPERRDAFHEWLTSVRNDISEASQITVAEDAVSYLSPMLGHKPVEAAGRNLFPSAVRSRSLDAATKTTVLLAEHKKKLDWPERKKFKVEIITATTDRKGFRRQEFANNGEPLPKHATLWFRAKTNTPKPFDVYWQVVNTGSDAIRAEGLRGGFDKGQIEKGRLKKKESTLYSGSHSIECFIIKNDYCTARSGPFIVNIA